jgi:hypothetical protein
MAAEDFARVKEGKKGKEKKKEATDLRGCFSVKNLKG